MNQYEAMFLFDPAFATDFGKAKEEVERILGRAEAEILFLEKWDERKLAYEIKGRKRGLYVLCFMKAEGGRIAGIERDAQLSESILRILITNANELTQEDIEKHRPQQRPAETGTPEAAPASGEAPKESPATGGAETSEAATAAPAADAPDAVAVAEAEEGPETSPEKKPEESAD